MDKLPYDPNNRTYVVLGTGTFFLETVGDAWKSSVWLYCHPEGAEKPLQNVMVFKVVIDDDYALSWKYAGQPGGVHALHKISADSPFVAEGFKIMEIYREREPYCYWSDVHDVARAVVYANDKLLSDLAWHQKVAARSLRRASTEEEMAKASAFVERSDAKYLAAKEDHQAAAMRTLIEDVNTWSRNPDHRQHDTILEAIYHSLAKSAFMVRIKDLEPEATLAMR